MSEHANRPDLMLVSQKRLTPEGMRNLRQAIESTFTGPARAMVLEPGFEDHGAGRSGERALDGLAEVSHALGRQPLLGDEHQVGAVRVFAHIRRIPRVS